MGGVGRSLEGATRGGWVGPGAGGRYLKVGTLANERNPGQRASWQRSGQRRIARTHEHAQNQRKIGTTSESVRFQYSTVPYGTGTGTESQIH